MGITYRASGTLSDLLQEFKKAYLVQLTSEDLKKKVILSIQEQEVAEDSAAEDVRWLKEKLVEVIENE